MFAEVVLHRRIPKQLDSFTYAIPENITVTPGQIVQVSFRKQLLAGIVRTLHKNTPQYATKFLEIVTNLILAPWQIELATWMMKKYECSFSKVIDLFVPEKVWPKVKKTTGKARSDSSTKSTDTVIAGEISAGKTPPNADKIFNDLINKLLSSPTKKLLLEVTPLPRAEFYRQCTEHFRKHAAGNPQALFLSPEVFSLNQFASDLPVFHGGLNENQKAALWHSVRSGETRIVAGTRAALFLPFKNLRAIIVDLEDNENYNEKRAPKYHALEVAEKIAQLLKIPIIIISSTPRVETWHKLQTGEYEKFELREEKNQTHISIVDMGEERHRGNYGIFAESVVTKIASCLAQDRQVLLFINRTGQASALFCRDCGRIFRCESCLGTLTIHGNAPMSQGTLVCRSCKKSMPIPNACDQCGNVKLKSLGFGTERLEKDIRQIFGKARVLRLDRETVSVKKGLQWNDKSLAAEGAPMPHRGVNCLASPRLGMADILVATQIIDKPLVLPRLALCVAMMPDPLLHFPHFRATERVFQLLTHIRHLLRGGGELMIQTFMPEHSLFQYLAKNRIEDFYASELETRKSLNLPPFYSSLSNAP